MRILERLVDLLAVFLTVFLFALGLIFISIVALPYRTWKERQMRGPPR